MDKIISFQKGNPNYNMKSVVNELRMLCKNNGFVRKGNSFFRVVGDGVFQMLKAGQNTPNDPPCISMGVLSMYSELQEQWFTSKGCIPRYYIVNLVGQPTPIKFLPLGDEYVRYVCPLENQVELLKEHGMCWLNGIATQSALVDALCHLDTMCYGRILWNDVGKFAPFLFEGSSENAKKVIDAILAQHNFAIERNRQDMDSSQFERYCALVEKEDLHLIQKKLLISGPQGAIRDYLEFNYRQNLHYCRLKKIPICNLCR